MLMQTEEMNAFLLFILKSKTKACVLKGNVCIWTIDQIQYLSLHRVVGIGYLYWKKKESILFYCNYLNIQVKEDFFFLPWKVWNGVVFLEQYL